MTDLAISIGLALSFGAWVTCHLAIVAALAARAHVSKALLGLLPPLAPLGVYWALKERMYIRVLAWGASLLAYVAFLCAAWL